MSAREDLRKKVDAEAVLYHNVCRYPFHYVQLVYQGLVGCGFAKWNVADADDPDHPWDAKMGYRIARGRAVAEIIKQIEGKPVTCDEAPDAVVKRMQKAKLRAEKQPLGMRLLIGALNDIRRKADKQFGDYVFKKIAYGNAQVDAKTGAPIPRPTYHVETVDLGHVTK
jgi:hypothetical protein